VLLVPDGPLHVLPFAALQVPGPDGRRRYLIELAPLHVAPSISVAARWRRAAEPPRPWSLAAFGDPTGTATTAARASLVRADGERLTALPGARDEVLGLRALFPGARIFVGADATEDRARQEAPRANLVHFACHGLLDERVPLDSGLALARSSGQGAESAPRGNGLLQAWEIFEQLRLDAELVTLSACDTATGAAAAGEGLQSLTRAFQFAGARRVLASLWPVSDASTAELMRRFYTRLSAGASPAEALQAAQAAFVERGGAQAHPFHWAAFTLHGDWR
jgi:CHAT domain-containing protein